MPCRLLLSIKLLSALLILHFSLLLNQNWVTHCVPILYCGLMAEREAAANLYISGSTTTLTHSGFQPSKSSIAIYTWDRGQHCGQEWIKQYSLGIYAATPVTTIPRWIKDKMEGRLHPPVSVNQDLYRTYTHFSGGGSSGPGRLEKNINLHAWLQLITFHCITSNTLLAYIIHTNIHAHRNCKIG